jgi:hypothetical protein
MGSLSVPVECIESVFAQDAIESAALCVAAKRLAQRPKLGASRPSFRHSHR